MLSGSKKAVPIIISLNKRDSPNAISVNEFKKFLSLNNSTVLYETIATQGINVTEVFKTLIQQIFKNP